MEFRNTYPAFGGTFVIEDAPDHQLALSWLDNPYRTTAKIDLKTYHTEIEYYDADNVRGSSFVV
jgi:sucrose phosphorylase